MRRLLALILVLALCCAVFPVAAQEAPGNTREDETNHYKKAVDFAHLADSTWGVHGKTEWYTQAAISEILIATYLQRQELINQNKEIVKLLKEKLK